jgi:hypothetical protein
MTIRFMCVCVPFTVETIAQFWQNWLLKLCIVIGWWKM